MNSSGITSKPANVALWGPDVFEITTLVQTLKIGKYAQGTASIHPFNEEITFGEKTFVAAVPSGNEGARRSHRQSLADYDSIVYVLDATDNDSLSTSKEELNGVLTDEALTKPILILVPKADASGVANESLLQELGLKQAVAKADGRVAVFAYSLSPEKSKGFEEGFRWLLQYL
ncbi:hypothetical protein NLJ89_g10417 [Agrocybe chaxingu]|uniref:Uncharacterized protein n=1 Tax=Agrocybe chaxingu TaxID=84603 RepID=A0A9W8MS58_9AGAR|nr:hypothetical protein NLJ89_g10417 [Agrocybe chaxingu]